MSKKKSLRLSPSTPLSAIEAKGRKAAILAENIPTTGHTEAKIRRRSQKRKTGTTVTPIQSSIGKIRNAIAAQLPKSNRIFFEKTTYAMNAHSVMCVYDTLEHRTIARYAFYASFDDPDKLGSVAIYCDNAVIRCHIIQRLGNIAGIPIKSATLMIGKRPFVNVDLRA